VIVKPETVLSWHRQGFRFYLRWKSSYPSGQPSVSRDIIDLIRKMSLTNPRWGAPRIHGELLKLGFKLSQATPAKYMVRRLGLSLPKMPYATNAFEISGIQEDETEAVPNREPECNNVTLG
jgi:hypothetical protein